MLQWTDKGQVKGVGWRIKIAKTRAFKRIESGRYPAGKLSMTGRNILVRRRHILDGDDCLHEGGCPPQLLQVAIELVPQ